MMPGYFKIVQKYVENIQIYSKTETILFSYEIPCILFTNIASVKERQLTFQFKSCSLLLKAGNHEIENITLDILKTNIDK